MFGYKKCIHAHTVRLLRRSTGLVLLGLLCAGSPNLLAEDNKGAEGAAQSAATVAKDVIYLELTPSFVTNFQAARLRYVKADVTIVAKDSLTAESITRNDPLVRHSMIMLLNRQSESNINTPEGRTQLKQDAIAEITTALSQEGDAINIKDILFTSFILE
jgi:flagellar FliL protein